MTESPQTLRKLLGQRGCLTTFKKGRHFCRQQLSCIPCQIGSPKPERNHAFAILLLGGSP